MYVIWKFPNKHTFYIKNMIPSAKTSKQLESQLTVLTSKEKQLTSDIALQQKEIEEAKTALDLAKRPLLIPVMAGVLSVYDSLKNNLDSQESDAERNAEIVKFSEAVTHCKLNLQRLETELSNVQAYIEKTREELQFVLEIAPHFDKFKSGYTKRHDFLKNRISAARREIATFQMYRHRIQQYLDGDRSIHLNFVPMGRSAADYLESINNKWIPSKERELEELENVKITDADLMADQDFLMWLECRVKLDKTVNSLIKSQERYVKDLAAFVSVAENNTKGLDFSFEMLPDSLKVIDIENEKIGLVEVNLSDV